MKRTHLIVPTVLVYLCGAAWITACSSDADSRARIGADAEPPAASAFTGDVSYDEEGLPQGLPHFRRWSAHLAQGGAPEGDEAYANLARLGYRTVLSVDGARPKVELAARHGLRTVHVPFGYDGIEPEQQLAIVQAVRTSDGPVYVHCHHGRHRGPAAALIAHIAVDGISNQEALEDLRVSGCSPDYPGLYRTIETFRVPTEAQLQTVGELPSTVVPEGLLALMSHIDERWDFVQASQRASWSVPAQFPDIEPAHEVGMIENSLRDVVADEQGGAARADFLEWARAAQVAASGLETALRQGDAGAASESHGLLSQACKACHAAYRN